MAAARFSGKTAAQEFLHLNFLHHYGMETAANMHPYQVRLAGQAIRTIFESVGVSKRDEVRASAFGDILRVATDDEGEALAYKVVGVLHDIFQNISDDEPFIANNYTRYVDLSKQNYPALVDDYWAHREQVEQYLLQENPSTSQAQQPGDLI